MQPANNTVIVTGGTSGIGLAFLRKFVCENNEVIVTGRDEKKLV